MKLVTFDPSGKKNNSQVSDQIFGVSANSQLLAQAVRVYIENSHQTTSQVQTRANVSMTKRKLYRQKGTGGARHGAKSAPIFVGGGVAFGPVADKSQNLKLSSVQKKQALKVALSMQVPHTVVMTNLEQLGAKTKLVDQAFKNILPNPTKILVIMSKFDLDQARGMTNLPYINIVVAKQVNAFQVSQAGTIVISPEAIAVLEDRLSKTTTTQDKQAKPTASKPKLVASDQTTKSTKPVNDKKVSNQEKLMSKKNTTPRGVKKNTAQKEAKS